MTYSVREIAEALNASVEGNPDIAISGLSEPASAAPDQLALAMAPQYGDGLAAGRARAAVLWDGADWRALGLEAAIFVPRPRYALSTLTQMLDRGPEIAPGIHPSAVIDPTAQIGPDAAIGPLVVVGPRARIGARARLAAHVSVGEDAVIGDDALLLAGVIIGSRVVIGDRFMAQHGTVVGSDGFSFVTPDTARVEQVRASVGQGAAASADTPPAAAQSWTRIHSLGAVRIGDDVELGANCTIDKGTIRDTRIGSRTKIDNAVHLAHNVVVGQDCLFAAQTGVAGSTRIGDRVVFGGQVGVADNITVGDDVIAGGGAKLVSTVPAGRAVMGYPAVKMETHTEIYKALRRLPRLFTQVAQLQKSVSMSRDND